MESLTEEQKRKISESEPGDLLFCSCDGFEVLRKGANNWATLEVPRLLTCIPRFVCGYYVSEDDKKIFVLLSTPCVTVQYLWIYDAGSDHWDPNPKNLRSPDYTSPVIGLDLLHGNNSFLINGVGVGLLKKLFSDLWV
ncbi:hypothetical protein COLO4_30965 [Corchorus olitorius]|uniref:Uncharacterized protein n=1 Tax=Corchorus olitorius TaxID=93759 RepID=A0A1R3H666_9ROSI|nr:hypothetical protein COLO4_30965 [Corchorus olitorius]